MTTDQKTSPNFFSTLGKELRDLWQGAAYEWRSGMVNLRNSFRKLQNAQIDYIVMPLSGGFPERDAPPRSFIERQLPFGQAPSISIQTLNRRFRRIAEAENAKGVLLVLQGIGGGLATLQSVRQAIQRLRSAGKEVVVYTPFLDLPHYFLAVSADKIIIPPSAQFEVMGFYAELAFYKDTLEKIGVELENFQISPYKTAGDQFSKSDVTAENAEMTNWLLDERYELLITAVSQGRNLDPDTVKSIIDSAPFSSALALEKNLIDHIAYEDELEAILFPKPEAEEDEAVEKEAPQQEPEKFLKWDKASSMLLEKAYRRQRKHIGVVSLNGAIMRGKSQDPPIDLPIPIVGGQTAGSETLTAVLRHAAEDKNMAGLIFHVNSPGGDSLASDLIGREIERIGKKIPVVVYMGDVAASGGYYVSAYAKQIVAQSGTITGSIGVLSMKAALDELNEKLAIKQVEFKRGENAGLYSSTQRLSESGRQKLLDSVQDVYHQFKEVVSKGRDIPYKELDPICLGRVWSGRQALEHGLVDALGDFNEALKIAAELAELPHGPQDRIPVVNIFGKKASYQLPKQMETAEFLTNIMTRKALGAVLNRPLLWMPFYFDKD